MQEERSLAPRIVSVVLFLAVIAGLVVYVLPLNAEYQKISADNQLKAVDLQQKQAELKELAVISKNLGPEAGSEEGVKRLLAEIPAQIDQEKLIDDFNRIAEAHRIVYSSFGFGLREGVAEGVNAMTINASFEGDYADLQRFLKALEANPRKLTVKNIGVQMGSKVEVIKEEDKKASSAAKSDAKPEESDLQEKQNAVFTLVIEAYYQA